MAKPSSGGVGAVGMADPRRARPDAPTRYLGPLSVLLLNQVFYFAVYPRRERGPTRAVIEWMLEPILRALDRIESVVRDPNLMSVLMVVGPLVLLAALHAAGTTWAFRRWRRDVAFAGGLLALVGLRGPAAPGG